MKQFDLDTPLIEFVNRNGGSFFTIRDAVEGCQVLGGIGSGKTSGSGKTLALKYLSNDFGGLVLTTKADEKEMWQEYCRLTNRSSDLVIIEPGGKHTFNFMEYEASRGIISSITGNLVEVLKTVIRASEEKDSGKSEDSFWETALDMLIFNVIDLCSLAYGKISIQKMYEIVLSAPKKAEEQKSDGGENNKRKTAFMRAFDAAQNNVNAQVEAWEISEVGRNVVSRKDPAEIEEQILEDIPDAKLLQSIDQFFIESFRNLSEKTRSIIEFSFSGFLFRLLKEPFYSLFCKHSSNVTPDDCLEGKIILLNLPVKQFHKFGRDSQIMFKYIWQRAMERRNVSFNDRPVFLWADEAQNFLHSHDSEYQATARSSRIATVYISQNLPNYYANMGGARSEHRVKSFLGTLGTKIFHANADMETNKYASELIGEYYAEDRTVGSTMAGEFSATKSLHYKLEKIVRPEEFVSLKTGGPLNNYVVQGYIHRQGQTFGEGVNHKKISFNQSKY